nr:TolC family protein [uncultured Fusobacterium sp.]
MNLRKVMGLAAFLVSCGISYGEESFGLNEILERVKTSNPSVKIQKLNTEIVEKQKDRALKNYILPPVKFDDSDEWDVVKKYGLGTKSLEVQMDVFEGGKSVYGYKVLKSQLAKSKNQEILTEIEAQENVVAAYFAVLNAQKQTEITERAMSLLEKQKSRVWDLYSNGKLVPKSEYLKIEADIENNRVLILENKQEEENTIGILNRLLGYPLDNNLILKDFDPEAYLMSKSNIQEKNNKKVENTLLGQNEKHDLDIAEYNVKLAKAELYPRIYTKYIHDFWERGEENKNRDIDEDRFELGFYWTFEWGGTLDEVASKKKALEQAQIKYDDNIKGITLEMKNQLNTVKALYGKAQAMKKRVDLLKENTDIDSMRYENELLSTFDYLNSVNSYRNAQEEYYKLQRELVLSVIEYENLYR